MRVGRDRDGLRAGKNARLRWWIAVLISSMMTVAFLTSPAAGVVAYTPPDVVELTLDVPSTTHLPGRYMWCLARLESEEGGDITYEALCYENESSPPPPPPPPYLGVQTHLVLTGQIDAAGVLTMPILPCTEFAPGFLAMSAELEVDFLGAVGEVRIVEDTTAPTDCAGATPLVGPVSVTSLPFVHDQDQDGCSDWEELGQSPTAGGLRDPFNPWDFFDPDWNPLTGTGKNTAISLGNVLNVVGRFGSTGDPNMTWNPSAPAGTYNPAFDRGPSYGPFSHNTSAPDGAIALGDVLAIADQFGHSC